MILLFIGLAIVIAIYIFMQRNKIQDYKSAQIIEKSEDGEYWFYVKPFGSYLDDEPTLIYVDQDTFDRFETGDWLTI